MATAESTRSVLLSHLAERFCALKDVKDFVCKWYPSLEVEVPAALLLHVTTCSIFSSSSIILPGLRASIGVTRSYSYALLQATNGLCPNISRQLMAFARTLAGNE